MSPSIQVARSHRKAAVPRACREPDKAPPCTMPLRIQNNRANSPFNDATPSMASHRRAMKVRRTSGRPRQESTNIRKS
eukprot:3362243-Pyramimonas_sp.AAC.1